MTQRDDQLAEAKARIGDLLDEALTLADYVKASRVAAHIADALHTLDPQHRIARPTNEDKSH